MRGKGVIAALIMLVVSALVLGLVSFLLGNMMNVGTFLNAFIAACVIALLNYLAGFVLQDKGGRVGRGLVGFLISALVIGLAAALLQGFTVTIVGALLAALLIGAIDTIIPTALR